MCHKRSLLDGRPNIESLLDDVANFGYKATGRKYGVSDNCIKKWIKRWRNMKLVDMS